MKECWECEAAGVPIHNHHPVPRSRGGTKTIPLCEPCHSKAHHRKKNMNTSTLSKEAMAKAKARGATFGNPNILTDAQPLGVKAKQASASTFNSGVKSLAAELRTTGCKTVVSLVVKLNEMGIRNRSGTYWTYNNLYRVLAS